MSTEQQARGVISQTARRGGHAGGVPAARHESSLSLLGNLSTGDFHQLLENTLTGDALGGSAIAVEAVCRCAAGRLEIRTLRLLLLDTPADQMWWRAACEAAMDAVVADVTLAPSILSMHTQVHRMPSASIRDAEVPGQAAFVAQASLPWRGQLIEGAIQRAGTRKVARQYAVASLLARLADLPEPMESTLVAGEWDDLSAPPQTAGRQPAGGENPVSVLNTYAQKNGISTPEYSHTVSEQGLFVATVRCVLPGRVARAQGSGPTKAAAKKQAAATVLARLHQPAAPPVGSSRANTAAAGVVEVPPTSRPATSGTASTPEPTPATVPVRPAAAVDVPADHSPAPSTPDTGNERAARGSWSVLELSAATTAVDAAVRAGAAATVLAASHPADTLMLLFDPAGGPPPRLMNGAVGPLREVTQDLVLAGPTGEQPKRTAVTGWAVPIDLMLPALMTTDVHAGPPVHPAVTGWRAAARLALELVAQRRVSPGLTGDGRDCWQVGPVTDQLREAVAAVAARLPPEAHCPMAGTAPLRMPAPETLLWAFLDATADAMVRTPGAAQVLGPGPWAGQPTSEPCREVWEWADRTEAAFDPAPTPRLLLKLKSPQPAAGGAPRIPAVLHLATPNPAPQDADADTGQNGDDVESVAADQIWNGRSPHPDLSPDLLPGARRILRRAARIFAPVDELAREERPVRTVLDADHLPALLGQTGQDLQGAGLRLSWPWAKAGMFSAVAVLGTPSTPATGSPGAGRVSGELGLEHLVDFRWRITLDGSPLTDEEMNALAAAARPLIHLRGRWLLIDPATAHRARHPALPPLPSGQALTAALAGVTLVDDQPVTVEPAGTLATLVDRLRHAPDTEPVLVPPTLNATLRSYQHRALSWLAHTTSLGFGALLADDMGLGKTITTIALHLHRQHTHQPGPTLVVCPASLVANWHREINRFAPTTPVLRYHGTDRTLDALTDTTVVITTYGTARRDTELLAARAWGLVVADEAQNIKNLTSQAAIALRQLGAASRVAVTGTPVENNLTELWAILDWANPGLFGTRRTWRARYGDVEKDPNTEAAGQLARLIAPFMMRRRKTDPGIAPELPAKVHHERAVGLTPEQAGLYEAVARDTLHQVTKAAGIARRGLVVKLLTALRQICGHPAHYLKEALPDTAAADQAAAGQLARRSGKLTALDDLLASVTARGEATLIFTSYVAMGRLLEAHIAATGRTPYFLHGATPPAQRQRMVDAFQHDPTPAPVFVISVGVGGTGLNLTRAEHVVHFDRPWNPAVEDQATDRAHRIGQQRTVHVHHLITENTVEDRITALLHRKRALGDAILHSGEAALADLDNTELAALVTLDQPGGSR